MSLEASLLARPSISVEGATDEKDRLLAEHAKSIKELEATVKSYQEKSASDSAAAVSEEERRNGREEAEKGWMAMLEEEKKIREEKERWAEEVTKALDKEKKVRNEFSPQNSDQLCVPRREGSLKMNDGHSRFSLANSIPWV